MENIDVTSSRKNCYMDQADTITWWEALVVWTTVGALLGIMMAMVFNWSPRWGAAVGIPLATLVGAGLKLLSRREEAS